MSITDTGTQTSRRITPQKAQTFIEQDGAFLLDVRGYDEFAAGHAAGATCIPLPDLERRAVDIPAGRPLVVMCQSGHRSAIAVQKLQALGRDNIMDVQGGFHAWRLAGLPTIKQTLAIPLERQVRIAAGILVLGFCLLGFVVSARFFWGAALIGFMLTLTGALGICPMISVLKLLPWNRVLIDSSSINKGK